jgi:REP element-mobilizing transposase RayT
MGRPLRHLPPGTVFEFTTRTIQSRYLLRPSESVNEILIGILGRALAAYPAVRLHAIAVLSNHTQGLASSSDGESLSAFIGYLKSNIARKLGKRVRWRGAFWSRRTRLIPVLDAAALVARLKYILSQGVKEGLVPHPVLWPGVHCARSLMTGEPLCGTWFNETMQWFARREGQDVSPRDFGTPMMVRFAPLPCWADLPIEEQQRRVRELVEEIVRENDIPGRHFLGVQKILEQDPHDFPEKTAKSPAPPCHASSKEQWKAYKDFLRQVVALYETVSSRFRRGLARLEEFPAYCYPPRLPFRHEGPVYRFEPASPVA